MKRTPWFDAATQNPVRVGVYEVQFGAGSQPWYSRWDGKFWCACTPYMTEAGTPHREKSSWMYADCVKWRGLTKEQK